VQSLNRNVPVYDVKTMTGRTRESTAKARFSALLLAVFAAIALVLAAIGIYGVMSYLVTQRTREIGIRIALGARSLDALKLVVRRGAALAGAGILIGATLALAATRALAALLRSGRAVVSGEAGRSGNLRGDRRRVGPGGPDGELPSGAARYLGGTLTGPAFGVAASHV
jgi:ABC-type antimicrobial peptide transport system permease subunit